MAQGKTPDIRVLVGVEGASLDGKSGKLIADELAKIATDISIKKTPQVAFTVNTQLTTKNIQNQLDKIVKGIKIPSIDLGIRTKETQVLNDLAVQKAKDADATKQQEKSTKEHEKQLKSLLSTLQLINQNGYTQKFNSIDQKATKLGRSDILEGLQKTKSQYQSIVEEINRLSAELNVSGDIKGLANKIIGDPDNDNFRKLLSNLHALDDATNSLYSNVKAQLPLFAKNENISKNSRDIADFSLSLTKFEKANDKFKSNSGFATEFERIKSALNDLDMRHVLGEDVEPELNQLKSRFKDLQISINEAGLAGQTVFGKLRTQMEKLGVYLSASAIIMGFWKQIKETANVVVELDAKITDLQIATGGTRQEAERLIKTYSEMGKELGATTVDVANAADAWLRQGYSVSDTNTLIKNSMILSKLGQIDSAEATKALTSAMKGYKLSVEGSIGVVDKFSALDMEAAVSAGYIATAMAETATGARLAGLEMDRLAGYITVVGETTQDGAESVGNFFKVLLARMGNVREGRLIDPETSEDLSAVETTLSGLGIKLRDTDGEFRNFGDVLDEVADKWDKYGSVTQRAIAVAFSGTRNQEKFLTLLDNYGQAMEYAETAATSAGTALDKYENSYLVSVEAAQDRFTSQFQALSKEIWDSELITGVYDTGTGILGLLTSIVGSLGTIPTLATVAAGALAGLNNKGRLGQVAVSQNKKYALLWLIGDDERACNKYGVAGKSHMVTSLKWCA